MDLALKDIRRHLGKFLATIAGVAMLLAIVLVMNGIYRGNIEDGVWLIDNMGTDLWVVERGRGGPFNEPSRMPADSYKSVAATPGVVRASPIMLYTAQRDIGAQGGNQFIEKLFVRHQQPFALPAFRLWLAVQSDPGAPPYRPACCRTNRPALLPAARARAQNWRGAPRQSGLARPAGPEPARRAG